MILSLIIKQRKKELNLNLKNKDKKIKDERKELIKKKKGIKSDKPNSAEKEGEDVPKGEDVSKELKPKKKKPGFIMKHKLPIGITVFVVAIVLSAAVTVIVLNDQYKNSLENNTRSVHMIGNMGLNEIHNQLLFNQTKEGYLSPMSHSLNQSLSPINQLLNTSLFNNYPISTHKSQTTSFNPLNTYCSSDIHKGSNHINDISTIQVLSITPTVLTTCLANALVIDKSFIKLSNPDKGLNSNIIYIMITSPEKNKYYKYILHDLTKPCFIKIVNICYTKTTKSSHKHQSIPSNTSNKSNTSNTSKVFIYSIIVIVILLLSVIIYIKSNTSNSTSDTMVAPNDYSSKILLGDNYGELYGNQTMNNWDPTNTNYNGMYNNPSAIPSDYYNSILVG